MQKDVGGVRMDLAKANSSMDALRKVQDAFLGEGEKLGLKTEEDVVHLIKEVRRETYEERQGG